MATDITIQAALDSAGYGTKTKILRWIPGATDNLFYATGGVDYVGKAKWTQTTTADDAATQAAAIQTNMAL